jgi:hypothetical protein
MPRILVLRSRWLLSGSVCTAKWRNRRLPSRTTISWSVSLIRGLAPRSLHPSEAEPTWYCRPPFLVRVLHIFLADAPSELASVERMPLHYTATPPRFPFLQGVSRVSTRCPSSAEALALPRQARQGPKMCKTRIDGPHKFRLVDQIDMVAPQFAEAKCNVRCSFSMTTNICQEDTRDAPRSAR